MTYLAQDHDRIRRTRLFLRACIAVRDAKAASALGGSPPTYQSDPTWLVNQAINRRVGWPNDPTVARGSAMPVNGHYPARAEGARGLGALGRRINTPRLVIHEAELGEWRPYLLPRLPDRFESSEDGPCQTCGASTHVTWEHPRPDLEASA